MNRNLILLAALLFSNVLAAQQNQMPGLSRFADLNVAIGSSEETVSLSYVRNWQTGKKRKLEMGIGGRLTAYSGVNREFYTAPARLARTTTIPFLVVFSGHEWQNTDTLTVQKAFTVSLNITANFGYRFSSKWYGGINIDLAGLTAGKTSSATLVSNGKQSTDHNTKPSRFNLLLTGDNDYGSLNSEFFARYRIAARWQLKALYQFYFAEYRTQTARQIAPDGTVVDRFRNKVNAFGIGLSYDL